MSIDNYGPIIIAFLVFSVMGVITIVAIRKYRFDQVLKLWQAQVAVFGVMIGAMTAHFYGAAARDQAIAEREQAYAERAKVVSQLEEVSHSRDRVLAELEEVSYQRDQVSAELQSVSAERSEALAYVDMLSAQVDQLTTAGKTDAAGWLAVIERTVDENQFDTVMKAAVEQGLLSTAYLHDNDQSPE